MYAPFFGLNKEPFSIAPDPRFLYMSERHREALAHLLYGLSAGGGFVLLTGEIGAGKTTVCRGFLEQVPSSCTVAYIFNPKLTVAELVQTVCDEFGVSVPSPAEDQVLDSHSTKLQIDALNGFLLHAHASGRQAVLVIDEAQSLSTPVLEQLRLLTNLETAERKLLQIILIGQPELRELLAKPELEQLAQRVIARYHLTALSPEETPQYVRHRLAVAGPNAALPFDMAALARLHAVTGGVPRRINLAADRALLGAYGQGRHVADAATVEQAAREVFGVSDSLQSSAEKMPRRNAWAWSALALGALALGIVLAGWATREKPAVSSAGAAPTGTAGLGAVTETVALGAAASAPAAVVTTAPPITSPIAPVPPPLADAATLLAFAQTDAAMAWRELALRWNLAVGEGEPCVAVRQADVACYRNSGGGLALVRQLARPGVLALRAANNADSRTRYALLVALDNERATLQVGPQRLDVSLPTLASVWRGDYATLWRTPPRWREERDPATDSNTRTWLTEKVSAALGQPAADNSTASLTEQIRIYQVAQGLPPDGRAGPVTLMRLNRSAGIAEPVLPTGPDKPAKP
jgi:general secretion pathway protein A